MAEDGKAGVYKADCESTDEKIADSPNELAFPSAVTDVSAILESVM